MNSCGILSHSCEKNLLNLVVDHMAFISDFYYKYNILHATYFHRYSLGGTLLDLAEVYALLSASIQFYMTRVIRFHYSRLSSCGDSP